MTEYEIIDAICDSVNPILFFTAVGVGIAVLVKKNYKKAGVVFGLLFGGLLLVYGTLFVDTKLKIWESFGGDYSTHTAFAIAACIAISAGKHWVKWLIGVFCLYVVAMLYQQYHSVLDIVTTTLVIGGPLILIRKYCGSFLASGVANIDSEVNYQ
ncbi:MAG: hypothetical protein AB2669_17560 [Candidatus Thiodiazotropha endolucinida]|nr:hypothetical protein [Candidatus Thiodiazotropha taylori]MCW4250829.1 hypothetical protein [Candidatus Thiodiazotropha endolucinida]MCG7884213.1 hypothetical protein [Candidatus Thiodiazotropha taylori]MCG8040092.1 hypothetical protein [Candidatus Thiodiazotropha taylori]MCG8104547.1 hypothetical protein [Candidatus Thiodiazotropha taylori]